MFVHRFIIIFNGNLVVLNAKCTVRGCDMLIIAVATVPIYIFLCMELGNNETLIFVFFPLSKRKFEKLIYIMNIFMWEFLDFNFCQEVARLRNIMTLLTKDKTIIAV